MFFVCYFVRNVCISCLKHEEMHSPIVSITLFDWCLLKCNDILCQHVLGIHGLLCHKCKWLEIQCGILADFFFSQIIVCAQHSKSFKFSFITTVTTMNCDLDYVTQIFFSIEPKKLLQSQILIVIIATLSLYKNRACERLPIYLCLCASLCR